MTNEPTAIRRCKAYLDTWVCNQPTIPGSPYCAVCDKRSKCSHVFNAGFCDECGHWKRSSTGVIFS